MGSIGFMGLGKLGLPVALAIESKGYSVVGNDIDPRVAEIIRSKRLPYREIGAQELLEKSNIKLVSLSDLVRFSEIIFVAIQTPHEPRFEGVTRLPSERMDFDYSYLKKGIKDLAEVINKERESRVVVIISTVLPGTIDREIKPLLNKYVKLVYNPFFIAMGTTIPDFLNPEFVLLGVDDKDAAETVKRFYRTFISAPFYECSIKEAECIKVFYNTFISTKIAFANTVMEICEKIGADCDVVMNGLFLGKDRIISSKYMKGGMGDGGGCHPRDNIALSWLAKKLNLSYDWFEHIIIAREKQTEWLAEIIENYSRKYKLPVIILGMAYKPETNITTGSPAILLKNILQEKGIRTNSYDPYVTGIPNFDEPAIFFIGTKHDIFRNIEFPKGSVIIDPWRYIPERQGIIVKSIGGKPKSD
ncbi:MAG: nucleotide sugar dehydrogenase [Thermoproteota archaeon]